MGPDRTTRVHTVQAASRTEEKGNDLEETVWDIIPPVRSCHQLEKNPNKTVRREMRLIWSWCWQKKMHFLLVVVVPFRSFWFVLLSCWGLEFPNYQSTHKALLRCLSVHASAVSYSPMRQAFFNKLIRRNFPIQSLSGNWSTAWHVSNEKMCLSCF